MLSKFVDRLRGRTTVQPSNSLRQAHIGPPPVALEPVRGHAEHSLAPLPELEADDSAIEITSLDQLPDWRGLVQNVVRESEAGCVVLDLGYRSVLVLATQQFFSSGAHGALMQKLKASSWSLDGEKTTSAAMIEKVLRLAEKRQQRASISSADPDRNEANVQLYKDLVRGAHALKASDIHLRLNIHDEKSVVRLRIDGRMRTWKKFDTQVLVDACAAAYGSISVKGTNSASSFTTHRPISTITRCDDAVTPLNGRFTTQPITSGCKITIRVINASEQAIRSRTLSMLGFTKQQIEEDLIPALAKDKGLFLISGSTGDGKTTTLQTAIMEMPNFEERELYGVEDPNEMEIPGMNHVSIQRNPDDPPELVKRAFDSALITMLRMDPDVMFLGEIRDRTSADFAAEGIVTGHLLLATVHGNSALDALFRLFQPRFDFPPEVVAQDGNFQVSMWQKLLPKLCKHCRVPAHAAMSPRDLQLLRNKFHLDTSRMWCANKDGCEHCSPGDGLPGNGEVGRVAAAEIIANPTPEFLEAVRRRDRQAAEMEWRRTRRAPFDAPDMRGKTAFESALYHAAMGIVSPLTIMEVFAKTLEEVTVIELPLAQKEAA